MNLTNLEPIQVRNSLAQPFFFENIYTNVTVISVLDGAHFHPFVFILTEGCVNQDVQGPEVIRRRDFQGRALQKAIIPVQAKDNDSIYQLA